MSAAGSSTHQVVDLVQELVDFLSVHQADVAFAEESAAFPPDFFLLHVEHDELGDEVVEHRAEETILVVLESLLLGVAERLVALHHLAGTLVHANHVALLTHRLKQK